MAEFKRASNEFKWQLEAEMRQIEAEATRERLIKAAPQTPPPALAPENGELTTVTTPPPELEIRPTTFGLEYRPTTNAAEASPELVAPEPARPEELKEPNA